MKVLNFTYTLQAHVVRSTLRDEKCHETYITHTHTHTQRMLNGSHEESDFYLILSQSCFEII